MPFKIKIKGEQHEGRPWDDEEPSVDQVDRELTWTTFIAWENYCIMGVARDRAIEYWEQYDALGVQMDERGVDHPKYGLAMNRRMELEGLIVTEQVLFLKSERRADFAWQAMRPKDREEEGVSAWFQVSSESPTLYGLWQSGLRNSRTPTFGMFPTALLIATPEQQQAYVNLHVQRMMSPSRT